MVLLALLVVAIAAYAPGLHGGFLFDDYINLPSLGAQGPIDNWAAFWRYISSGTADPTGRPLTLLTFLLDARDWPASPYSFKRTSLVLHLINGALLYALLCRLGAALHGRADETTRRSARIAASLWLLHPLFVSTTLYNNQFPGPLLRFREGQRVVVDVHNDTDTPELVHWHGQMIPSDVDGAVEERTPFVPAHGMRRISFTPKPSGFRFYHTHVAAGGDLGRGTYTGQAGPVYIEPRNDPGAYDREIFLVLKEFMPTFSRGGDMAMDALIGTSITVTSAAAHSDSTSRTKGTPTVQVLTSVFMAFPASKPSGPESARRKISSVGSETMIVSHVSANSFGEVARRA